ncbi:MAG: hypothetical protein ACK5LC_09520 [Coprobacillaceae bacterium]
MGYEISNTIMDTVLKTRLGWSASSKIGVCSLAVASSIGFITYMNQDTKNNANTSQEMVLSQYDVTTIPARIQAIDYDTNWTNKEVALDVITTTENYDMIVINDVETTSITENGNYVVKLIKDNQVIDQKDIQVTNIDLYSPDGYSIYQDNKYILYLQDDLSQIDYESIEFYRDGMSCTEYLYCNISNTITIEHSDASFEQVFIKDYAGNILEVEIK